MIVETYSAKGRSFENEDFLLWQCLGEDKLIAIVADGMGGLDAGALAARKAGEAIVSYVSKHFADDTPDQVLTHAIRAADEALRLIRQEMHINLGTSIAALILSGGDIYFTWLGNVRVYRVVEERAQFLTEDHSVDVGYGNRRLTRCLKGIGNTDNVPVGHSRITEGTSIVICTDGLYENEGRDIFANINLLRTGQMVPVDDASLILIKADENKLSQVSQVKNR